MQVMGFIRLQVDPHIAATFVWLNASPIDTLLTAPRRHLDSLLTPLHLITVEGAVIVEAVAILPSPSSSRTSPSSQWWLCGGRHHPRCYHRGGGRVAVAFVLVISIRPIAVLVATRLRGFSGGLMKGRRAKTSHKRSWLNFVTHLLAFHSAPCSFPIPHPSSCENLPSSLWGEEVRDCERTVAVRLKVMAGK